MDDGTRISEEVEVFLRAARAKDVKRCAEILQSTPELVNSVEAGGFTAMHFAAFNGDLEMIKMLLDHHADASVANYDGNTPLVMAVKGHQIDAIHALLKAGVDINHSSSPGATPVLHAAAMGYVDVIRLLVSSGANVCTEPTECGSLLHWGCHSGDINCVGAILYEFGVPINTVDAHGGPALFTALFMKKTEVVQFLLEHGADVHVAVPGDKTTALHIAVTHGNTECVKLLCDFGANTAAQNNEGQTCVDLAKQENRTAALRELTRFRTAADRRHDDSLRAKEQGNKVFANGENVKAAKFYTLAIHLDNTNHVFFSNRAACYFNQQLYQDAKWDSCRCVMLKPDWPKAYLRKSASELALKQYSDANATALTGLKLDPRNKDLLIIKDESAKMKDK